MRSLHSQIISKGGKFNCQRFSGGSYVSGIYEKGPCTPFEVRASIQPLTAREILNLPEADRTKDHRKMYTVTEMRPYDIVFIGPRKYEVRGVEEWDNHYKVLLRLKDV